MVFLKGANEMHNRWSRGVVGATTEGKGREV